VGQYIFKIGTHGLFLPRSKVYGRIQWISGEFCKQYSSRKFLGFFPIGFYQKAQAMGRNPPDNFRPEYCFHFRGISDVFLRNTVTFPHIFCRIGWPESLTWVWNAAYNPLPIIRKLKKTIVYSYFCADLAIFWGLREPPWENCMMIVRFHEKKIFEIGVYPLSDVEGRKCFLFFKGTVFANLSRMKSSFLRDCWPGYWQCKPFFTSSENDFFSILFYHFVENKKLHNISHIQSGFF
jgi:hypothetical protein